MYEAHLMRLRVTVTHVLMWWRAHTTWPVFTHYTLYIFFNKNSGIVAICTDMFENVDFMKLGFRATD